MSLSTRRRAYIFSRQSEGKKTKTFWYITKQFSIRSWHFPPHQYQHIERPILNPQITFWLLKLMEDWQKRQVSFPDKLLWIWLVLGSLPKSLLINPEEHAFKDGEAESWSLIKEPCERVSASPMCLHRLYGLKKKNNKKTKTYKSLGWQLLYFCTFLWSLIKTYSKCWYFGPLLTSISRVYRIVTFQTVLFFEKESFWTQLLCPSVLKLEMLEHPLKYPGKYWTLQNIKTSSNSWRVVSRLLRQL